MTKPLTTAKGEQARYGGDFSPVAPPSAFIQWKGTDVCLDFQCACGGCGHFDGYFAYAITCGDCGAKWAMPHTVALVEPDEFSRTWHKGVHPEMEVHE